MCIETKDEYIESEKDEKYIELHWKYTTIFLIENEQIRIF